MNTHSRSAALILSLSVSMLALTATAVDAQPANKAGVAAAVNARTDGTPSTSATRRLEIGNDVFQQERIATDAQGQAQMLFLDGSAFTVGPNAEVVLDEFVYDPSTEVGKLAVSASKGLMRFVGGKLSKKDAVAIKTPTATLGIRGGIALVEVDGQTGATEATLLFGDELTVRAINGEIQRITRPGFSTTVASRDSAPTSPRRAEHDRLGRSLNQLNGRPGAGGGAREVPTEAHVAGSLVGGVNSRPVAEAMARGGPGPSGPGPGPGAPPPPPPPPHDPVAAASQTGNKATAAKNNVVIGAYAVAPDPSLNSAIPSVRGAVGGNLPGAVVSHQFLVTGTGSDGIQTRGVQASIVINGQGAGQRSLVVVTTSEVLTRDNGRNNFLAGTERGSARTGATDGSILIGALTTTKNDSTFSGNKLPDTYVSGTSDPAGVRSTAVDVGLVPATKTEYSFVQNAFRVAPPAGVGVSRTGQVMGGYATGMVDTRLPNGTRADPTILTSGQFSSTGAQTQAGPDAVQIATNPGNHRIAANFNLSDGTTDIDGRARTRAPNNYGLKFGSLDGPNNARSAFIDDNAFAAGETLVSGTNQVASTVNGNQVISDPNLAISQLYLVSSALASTASVLPAGVQFCQCEFVKWGFWGGQLATGDASALRLDRIHLGTWVAGPMARASDMPQTGIATFVGHAIGTVVNGSAQYIAGGGFSNVWDFGRKQGALTISNFDGLTMSGALSSANGRDYGGTLAVTGQSGLGGSAQGSFFMGRGDPARETGGQFVVKASGTGGSRYGATGIFVGRKP
ncbi:MAG: FecR domain-containing protein [Proteobacteria bacterium]|nr:FecR domain-containing protein [Pseudomonadota bacterium]MBI3497129.1 FecR domain-containing protein [Pseudomonadota bacterium]